MTELLSDDFPADKAVELARLLSEGTWTHDYPITPREAKELGLNVNTEMPEEILNLLQLYPQPQRRLSSVEYVPHPYRSGREHTS